MYMSPEQARGEQLDQQTDLFSLGSVLYSLCTGKPPFRGDTSYGVMRKIIDEDPTPVRELNPEIPIWMVSFIEKLMSKKKAIGSLPLRRCTSYWKLASHTNSGHRPIHFRPASEKANN
jgi:serine/threonine protein kinase